MKKLKQFFLLFLIIGLFIGINFNSTVSVNAIDIPEVEVGTTKENPNNHIKNGLKAPKTNLFNKILLEYRTVIVFVSGIGTLSMILFFILNLIALGNSKGNPQERQKAITGLVVTGIATAGLGSVTLISQLFYYMIS